MANIDRHFVTIGLAWLILGMVLGFYMGASGNNQLLDVHVAMVLPGFAVLTVYGVLYRLWPAMKQSPLAILQFWVAIIGVLALVVGAIQLELNGDIYVVAAGSALAILAAGLMAWLFWTLAAD